MPASFSLPTKCLLALLLLTDLSFICAHLIHTYTPFLSPIGYSIEQERGYSEIFQYIKYFWTIAMLGVLTFIRREWNYGLWMLLFIYLLGDDASQFHERGGELVTAAMAYQAKWGLRAQDFGELTISLSVLAVFSVLSIKAYLAANANMKMVLRGYALLLGMLGFFGVVVDMFHVVAGGDSFPMLGVLEDGGEMIAVSLICWYTFHLMEHKGILPVQAWKELSASFLKPGISRPLTPSA